MTYKHLILIFVLLLSFNYVLAINCGNEQTGFEEYGYDYYIFCEENFVDEYYEGYDEFLFEEVQKETNENKINQNTDDVKLDLDADIGYVVEESLEDDSSNNKIQRTFDGFFSEDANTSTSKSFILLAWVGVILFIIFLVILLFHRRTVKNHKNDQFNTLIHYIVSLRLQGFSDEVIYTQFLQKGYDDAFIKKLFDVVKHH